MSELQLFEGQEVRRHFDINQEIWFFSVIDIVSVLTGSNLPKRYWSDLKRKLTAEGSQLYEKIVQLKFKANDGKSYATDCMSTENLLRLVQSIPSPKAEPFKVWLAKVGYERIQELNDPAQGLDRARENWQKLGRSEKWIQQRMTGQETRNKLTDHWKDSGVDAPDEFALLTNIIHQEWTGLSVKGQNFLPPSVRKLRLSK
jgi:DNA-damage-inducible protein D